jgi:ribosome-associated protein
VTLQFNVDSSTVLSPEQRLQIRSKLSSRINKDGILQVTSQRTRSQELNRADTVKRFAELLNAALHREVPRIPTRATLSARIQRVEEKKKRTEIKKARAKKDWDE